MNEISNGYLPSPLVIIGPLLICYYWIPALEWKLVTRTHGKYFVVYIVLITSVCPTPHIIIILIFIVLFQLVVLVEVLSS